MVISVAHLTIKAPIVKDGCSTGRSSCSHFMKNPIFGYDPIGVCTQKIANKELPPD